MATFRIQRADGSGEPITVDASDLMTACAQLSDDGAHKLTIENLDAPQAAPTTPTASPAAPPPSPKSAPTATDTIRTPPPAFSTFERTRVDDGAKARIEATHDRMRAAGVDVDTSKQFFATGTRMATDGYDRQHERKAEHEAAYPLAIAADRLARAVNDERRADREVSAAELGRAITVNGSVSAFGLELSEHAIRGLATRLESPMLRYVLGVRERIACESTRDDEHAHPAVSEGIRADKRMLADVLAHECKRKPDVALKLRTRQARGDVFAILSPGYANADAPSFVDEIVSGMPDDARATYSYDPESTHWELRAQVWTPTPVDQQAVGEPFEGFVSFRSHDHGGGSLGGGGGINVLRCLNASVYMVGGSNMKRAHRGRILLDVSRMIDGSLAAVRALCAAWGTSRKAELPQAPTGTPIEEVIPGFWRYQLTAHRGDLAHENAPRVLAVRHHQAFKRDFLVSLPRDPRWQIQADRVGLWLDTVAPGWRDS